MTYVSIIALASVLTLVIVDMITYAPGERRTRPRPAERRVRYHSNDPRYKKGDR